MSTTLLLFYLLFFTFKRQQGSFLLFYLFTFLPFNKLISSLLDELLGIFLRIARAYRTSTQSLLGTYEVTILVGRLDDHVVVFHHHELEELLPTCQHLLSLLDAIIVEILDYLLRILRIELLCLCLHLFLGGKITIVKTVAHLLQ